jgi:hypothetical protein
MKQFTNVYSCAFFFPSNHGGDDKTRVQYIGMQVPFHSFCLKPVSM